METFMNAHLPYTATAHHTEKSALLEMVARLAPLFLKTGGGATLGGAIDMEKADPVTDDEKRRFAHLIHSGRNVYQIAEETGRHYTTIARHTRHLRRAGKEMA
jgi:hypothetical protein